MKYDEIRMVIQAYAKRIVERPEMSYADMRATLARLERLNMDLADAWSKDRP